MRLKNLLPRTLLVVSLVLVVSVILTTRSAFVSADDQIPQEHKPQANQENEQNSHISLTGNSQSEACPCISRDACPRIYGQSALDIRELGIVKPCAEDGTVRCCGVTISVVQKSDQDAENSRSPIEGEVSNWEKATADGEEIESEVEILEEIPSGSTGEDREDASVEVHMHPEIVELSLLHAADKNASDAMSSVSDEKKDSDADLVSAESMVIKSFESQGSKPPGIKMRRKKVTTAVNSVLSLDADGSSSIDTEESSSFGDADRVGGGNGDSMVGNNPGRVAVTAFAKEGPSSRIAATTIFLGSQSDSTAGNKIQSQDIQSPTRKFMKPTRNGGLSSSLSTTESNVIVANGNHNATPGDTSSETLPAKPFTPFGRQKFGSHSQTGGTSSSTTTTGTTHSAVAFAAGSSTVGLNGKFKRPSSIPTGVLTGTAERSQGTVDKADLISTTAETPHVSLSPVDQKDKVDANGRPMSLMIRPFVAGGRRKLSGGAVSSNSSTTPVNSTTTLIFPSPTLSNALPSKTKNNFLSGQTSLSPSANVNSKTFANEKSSIQVALKDAVPVVTQKPIQKGNSSSSGSMPTFVPKIRPFTPKKGNVNVGSATVTVTLNKSGQEKEKVISSQDIPVETQNKGVSFALNSPTNNHSSNSFVNKAPVKLQSQSAGLSFNVPKIASTSPLPSLSHAQTSYRLENEEEPLEKIVRKPGLRRRKTTFTTPAPDRSSEGNDTVKVEESYGESAIPVSSKPFFPRTKSSYKSTLAPVQIDTEDNAKKQPISHESPVLKVQSISPSQNGNSQSAPQPIIVEKENLSPPPATQTTSKRGYRKRLRPLAQTHHQNTALTQEEIIGQPMPLPTVTTEEPRVSSPYHNQNGKYESEKESDESSQNSHAVNEMEKNTAGESFHSQPAGNFKGKFRQQLTVAPTTSLPVLALEATEKALVHEYEDSSNKSPSGTLVDLSSEHTTESGPPAVSKTHSFLGETEPRRKFFGSRYNHESNSISSTVTTGSPSPLMKTNALPEESLVTLTSGSGSSDNGKYPIRMTSTYSRIRVNNHNEDGGNVGEAFHHANNAPNSNRRFRIPAALQVVRGSSATTPESGFVDSASSGGIPEESDRRVEKNESKEFLSEANYGGGSEPTEEGESYDLILDKEARKSMYNQTTNFFPSTLSLSQSPTTDSTPMQQNVPAMPVATHGHAPRQVVKIRRRRPGPIVGNTMTFEENEQKHLEELKENSGGESQEESVNENGKVIVVAAPKAAEKDEDGKVDIDLKVNIDVNVDNGSEEEELEMDTNKQGELEAGGEQESRVHAKYVKRKFPILLAYNRTDGNSISYENGNENGKVNIGPGFGDSEDMSNPNANPSMDNLLISSANSYSTTSVVSSSPSKKIRKTQRGNSTRFAVDSIKPSAVKSVTPFVDREQVGHSHAPVKSNDFSSMTRHTNMPERFSFSSSSSESASSSQGLRGGQTAKIADNSQAALANDNDKAAHSVIGTHNNYQVVSSTPIASSAETTDSNSSPKFVFPPYRKSVLIVSSTTVPPPTSTVTRTRYSHRNRTVSTTNDYTASSPTPLAIANVESVVEFNSVPTRTSPPEPLLPSHNNLMHTDRRPDTHNLIGITDSDSDTNNAVQNTNRHNLMGNSDPHSRRVANNEFVRERQHSRFKVSQFTPNSANETRIKMRKKHKNKVNSNNGNDFSTPAVPTHVSLPVKQEAVFTAIKNPLLSSGDRSGPPSTFTTFTIAQQPFQLATTTESQFSQQIPPTEMPHRYTPTSPITPIAVTPNYYSIEPQTPAPVPVFSSRPTPAATSTPQPPTISFYNNLPQTQIHSGNSPAKLIDEYAQNVHSEKKSPTKSRFSVPEQFSFSGWRVSGSQKASSTTARPTAFNFERPREEIKYEVNVQPTENLNIPTINQQSNFNRFPIDTNIEVPTAYQSGVPQQQNFQYEQQQQIAKPQIPTSAPMSTNLVQQDLYNANLNANGITHSESANTVGQTFDNGNYQFSSNNQGFSIHLSNTNAGNPDEEGPANHRLPVLPQSIPATQVSYTSSPPVPSPQPTSSNVAHQQFPTTSIRSPYQGNNFPKEAIEQDKRQNYFSHTPGPLSYSLPILPQHNPNLRPQVNIQYGEAVNANNNEQKNTYPANANSMQTAPTYLSNEPLSQGMNSQAENQNHQTLHPSQLQSSYQTDSRKSQSSPPTSQLSQVPHSSYSGNSNIDLPPPQQQQQQQYSAFTQNSKQNPSMNSDLNMNTNAPPLISTPLNPPQPQGNYWSQSPLPIVLKESKLHPYQYQNPSHMQNPPVNGYNNYNNPQPQQNKVNLHGSFPQQSQSSSNPITSFSFNSQGYTGNDFGNKPVVPPTLHVLPLAVQKQLPAEHLKEYHQHMQISQHIMNHMNRYNGRTSRAHNLTEADDPDQVQPSGSEIAERVVLLSIPGAKDGAPGAVIPPVNILNGTANVSLPGTHSSALLLNSDDRQSKGLEANRDELMGQERQKTEYDILPPLISELAAQSEKTTEEGKQQAAQFTSETKTDETSKDNAYVKENPLGSVNTNSNSSDGKTAKQEFTPPKVIHGGFLPILPYSEKDPGPILVKILPKQEKIPVPLETQINGNLLNHPNVIPQTKFHNIHNQIIKHYSNTPKVLASPK